MFGVLCFPSFFGKPFRFREAREQVGGALFNCSQPLTIIIGLHRVQQRQPNERALSPKTLN